MLVDSPKSKSAFVAIVSAVLLLGCYGILARSCQFDHRAIAAYGLYVLACVWLPGHGLLTWVSRERIGLARSLALGLPLGFGIEIASYLSFSALGLREWHATAQLVIGLALAGTLISSRTWRMALPEPKGLLSWQSVLLAAAALLVMINTAARMYAPSPMFDGLLFHATHHDWVYLISRAAELKHHWPLEDPSLAGTTMGYHYFLMVHVAAVSNALGIGPAQALLRMVPVTLGAVLLLQTYVLGRTVGRSRWAGVIAVWLLFGAGEVSWVRSTGGGLFQNLFLEWLFVSPTFFFGMIFMGALLLWMHRLIIAGHRSPADYGVLLFLSIIGTGAKGTTVGPLVVALGFLIVWLWWRRRAWNWELPIMGILLTGGFVAAYTFVLRQWSGEGTTFALWSYPSVSAFWLTYLGPWRDALASLGMPVTLSDGLAQAASMLIVFTGANGVLALGLAYPFMRESRQDDAPYIAWLGFVAFACILFGHLLYLDSHGETYLYYPIRLLLAVLTAAWSVAMARRWHQRHNFPIESLIRNFRILGILLTLGVMVVLVGLGWLSLWVAIVSAVVLLMLMAPRHPQQPGVATEIPFGRFALRLSPALLLLAVLGLQGFNLLLANDSGLRLWRAMGATAKNESLADLSAGLHWLRKNSSTDAVIFATSYMDMTPGTLNTVVVDDTTLDKYYYYSALSERRFYIEGPAYMRDQKLVEKRLTAMSALQPFTLSISVESLPECYLLVDRQREVDPGLIPPGTPELFGNARIGIYRMSAPLGLEPFASGMAP